MNAVSGDDRDRTTTGIDGFDFVAGGGLPSGRITLVAGAAGTGKTVFGLQFAVEGGRCGEPTVYVGLEESPEDLRRAASSLGWDLDALERDGMLAFVDAAHRGERQPVVTGAYDLDGLLTRVRAAVDRIGARRVVVDAVTTLLSYLPDERRVRWELFRLRSELTRDDLTTVVTAERDRDERLIARHGVEAFVLDSVIVLRNVREGPQRQRTIAIEKFRAANHQQGEFPYSIRADAGIVVVPLSSMVLEQQTPTTKVSTGVEGLDAMCEGGLFESSTTLVAGETGTGKTLTACHFISATPEGERAVLFGFEESRTQVLRDAEGWGMPLRRHEEEGRLELHCEYPEVRGLEDHLLRIRGVVERVRPARVAIDSLSALQRVGSPRAFREFGLGVTSLLKEFGATVLLTAIPGRAAGPTRPASTGISSVTDALILLRYYEVPGQVRRSLTVLKMRGTAHDTAVRDFTVDGGGMRLGESLSVAPGGVSGGLGSSGAADVGTGPGPPE